MKIFIRRLQKKFIIVKVRQFVLLEGYFSQKMLPVDNIKIDIIKSPEEAAKICLAADYCEAFVMNVTENQIKMIESVALENYKPDQTIKTLLPFTLSLMAKYKRGETFTSIRSSLGSQKHFVH